MANSGWGKATSATQRAKDIKKQEKKKKEEQEQKLYYPQNVNRNYYDSDDLLDQMMQERSSRPRPTVTGGTKVSAEPGKREQDTSVTRSNVNTDVASPSELRPTVNPQETRNAAMDMLKRTLGGFQTAAQNAMKYASGDFGVNQLEMAKREAQRQQALNSKLPKFLQSTSAGLPDYFRQYLNMSPEEQTEYNQEYIHGGNAAAERYKDSVQNNINQRIAQENYDKDPFVKNPVGRTVGQFTSGISRFGEGIENLPAWVGISDKKKAASVDQYASQLYKQNSTGKLENIAQDLASTMGYMTPATIAGGAAGAAGLATAKAATLANGLFGLATGGNAYQEAINEGKNKYASAAFGAQQAVDEMVTNYLIGGVKAFGGGLIGKYLSNTGVAKAAQQGIMNLAKTPSGKILLGRMLNHLGHATEEAAQEYLQNFTEKISRNILFGEDNKIDPMDPDAWYAAGLGALNALTMNVATDTIHLANNEMQHRAERRAQEEQAPQESYVDVPDDAVREAVDGIIPENNIVSEDPAKTQQENTHDTINAAVDALKEQANENTSTSTPDDAKAAVETAKEQIEEAPVENIPQETVENQPTEDIVLEEPVRNEEPVDEIAKPEENIPDQTIEEPKTANEKLLEIANDLNNNTQENVPEEAAAPSVDAGKLSDILSVSNHANINGFDYNVTETSAGFHGSIRDTSKDIGNVMNGHAINYTYDGPTRQDVIDQLVGVAENNGFIENPNYKDNKNTVNETAMPESKASFAAPDITGEVAKRAEMRFPNNEDAQKVYNGFLPVFNSDGSNELEMYDHFMSMAYQAGLEGNPISSLSDDKVFVNFSSMYPSMIDAIWRTGYNQYENNNRANVKTDADNVNENVDNVNKTVDNANENVNNTEEVKPKSKETEKKVKSENKEVKSNDHVPAKAADVPQLAIADKVSEMITKGKDFSSGWLFDIADKAYGGSQADGTYTVKDAYDGMELGINKYLMSADFVKNGNGSLAEAKKTLSKIQDMLSHIPTQTKRTAEMEAFQQFSTPANLAYTAAWLANINDNDTVLEPSAGIGGLALFGKAWGAKVYANELSKRRLQFLNQLGLDETFNENAEHINDILPDYVKPTVVLMNPPFSSTAGRTSKNSTANAKVHIEQALDRLSNNGRLVAIVGKGMADNAPSFRSWWNDLRKDYDIKANVRIDGSNFKKNGTTFDDQLVIIDKTGPQDGKTLTGEYKDLSEVLTDLEGIRNERIISGSDTEPGRSLPVSSGDTGLSDGRVQSGESTGDSSSGNLATNRRGTDTEIERGTEQSGVRRGSDGTDVEGSSEGSTETERDRDVSTRQRGSRGRDTGRVAGTDVKNNESDSAQSSELRLVPVENKKKEINIDSTYTNYAPSKVNIKGAKPHPGVLVESAAMGAVEPPDATYVPHLPQELIESGNISAAQLENIVYAGQAHQTILPNGSRKGYFIGDGTGVGKGRQLAAIILDNFNQGKKKAIWVSEKTNLMLDAQRDWKDLGQDPKDVFDFQKATAKGKDIPDKNGILFAAYSTLGARKQAGIDQIKKWVGEDFDGVIVLDEAHNMKGAMPVKGKRGTKKPAEQALWGIELQKQLPKARVVYATATGASDISQYAYLERLGLWGPGTGFDNFRDFASSISSGGLAAMELVARDMKSMGDYMARSISYDGVQYDTITHHLDEVQTDIYNKMSEGWRTVLRNVEKAIEITGADSKAKSNARQQFWGTLQRFYNQILTSMSLPSVITDMENELKNGRSIVIQLVNTNASQTDKKLAAMKDGDLENLDLTPSESLIDYLKRSFPVQAFEKYEDEDGNTKTRPVVDSKGNPVNDKRAVALRDKLIDEIGKMQVPDGPLEMILDHFGVDKVAEVTGRTRRVVYKKQSNGRMKRVTENWSKAKGEADANAFQDGKKRIIIFSEAGGTGKSYHADRRAKNQQQRVHYILQPGWKADTAIQGLGRTHRTNEASQPIYKLVTTDVMGQKRFTSTIAKRLNQMGALTKGQRDAGSGIFSEKDNLETPLAADALEAYYRQAPEELVRSLGVNIYDEYGRINDSAEALRDVSKFLNRILALDIKDQNEEFEKFYSILEEKTEQAIKNGTLDRGLETIKADKIAVIDEKEVYKNENSSTATNYVQLKVSNKPELISYERIMDNTPDSMVRLQDGSVRAVYKGINKTDPRTGKIIKTYLLQSPIRDEFNRYSEKTLEERTTPIPKNEWKKAWAEEIKKAPEYIDNTVHMLTGTLLPIWKQLPQNNTRVMRIVTDDGKQYLGRIIDKQEIDGVLRKFGTDRTKENYTSKDLMKKILDDNQEIILTFHKRHIKRSRVANDYRIEITGNNLWSLPMHYDVFSEKINGKDRYFIPTGERGEKTLAKLLAANAIRDIVPAGTADDDVLYSKSGHVRTKPEKPTVKEIEAQNAKLEEQKKAEREKGVPTSNVEELEKDNSKDWTAEKNMESTVDTSKRLSDIIGEALHDFGINYTSGTRYVKGDGVEGEYNRKNHGIRTKITNDLPTFSHEFGHWLDQKYNVITDEMPTDVLKDLKTAFEKKEENKENYTQDLIPREGFGEYIRYYLQNRDTAGMDYPKLTEYFLKKLSPKELAELNGFADQVNAYYSMDTDSAAGHIRLKEDSRPDYRTTKEKFHDWWHHGYQEWVDSNHGFRMFDIANKTDSYTYAANAAYTDARVVKTLTDAIYTPEGYYVGPGLKYALRNINVDDKQEYMDFGEYLICRHAVEWIEQKKRVFADDRKNNTQWLNNRRKELEKAYPKFSEAAEDVYRFQHDFLQTWGIGSGIISADAFEAMQKMYPEYVPFFRAGFKNRGDALKKAKGSGRDLIHPIDNIIDSVTKTMHTATPNKVMLILRNEAIKHKADALWMEQIPEQKFAEKFSTEELKTKLKDNTAYTLWGMQASAEAVDAMQDIIDTIDDMLIQYRSGRALKSRNEFRIMVNGKPEYWKINNELLLNSVLDMDYRDTNKVIKAFGDMNRLMTYATTGGNIVWATTSNSVRDLLTMITYSPAKKLPKRLRNLCEEYVQATKKEMGKSVSPIYEQYLALGGDDAQVYSGSEKYVKDIRKMLSKKKSFNPLRVTNFISDTIEAGPRFAIFKEFIENGAEPQKAFRAAMDITTDFKRHGKNSKMMNNFLRYFNASLQGVDKFVRYFTAEDRAGMKDRKKVIMGRALYLLTISAIGAALSYFLNHKDEEDKKNYNLLSTYTKNNYYSVPIPGSDGKYLTIPKAHETAVLESFMERLLEYSLDNNKHAFDEFYNYGADQFAPNGASDFLKLPANVATKGADQAARELLSGVFSGMGPLGVGEQIAANRNYMGRPIENTFEAEKLKPSERYNENTSQAAYLAGKYLNLSPKMVDHFGENVLGFMWKYPEALFPIDDGKGTKGKRDFTLGVGKTYIRDNTYSNDVTNYIYDKANESAMEHNSTGEKAAEAKADSNMSQFYTTFNKLSKEEPESNEKRSARKNVLNDLLDYRDKTGSLPTTQQEIYDMVDRTGDTSLMPGVMKSTIKDAEGNEHSLTSGEYVNLQKSYEDYYWRYAGESFNNSEPDDKKAYVLEQAAKLAKEQAQSDMLNQKGMASSSDKLLDWVQSGNDFDTYVDTVYNIKAIKNEYAGSDNKEERQSEIAREIQSTGLSEDSKKKLWEIAGYKATEGSYGKFF